MPLSVFCLVLFAAPMHAGWNALVKGAPDKLLTTVLVSGFAALIAACALPFLPAPAAASWPLLLVVRPAAGAVLRPGGALPSRGRHEPGLSADGAAPRCCCGRRRRAVAGRTSLHRACLGWASPWCAPACWRWRWAVVAAPRRPAPAQCHQDRRLHPAGCRRRAPFRPCPELYAVAVRADRPAAAGLGAAGAAHGLSRLPARQRRARPGGRGRHAAVLGCAWRWR